MALSPTTYSSSLVVGRTFADMRQQLDGLNQQLNTGKRADSYADLGLGRTVSLALRQEQAQIASYQETATLVSGRLQIVGTTLDRISALGTQTINRLTTTGLAVASNGVSDDQRTAKGALDELISHLNSSYAGRALFAGRAVDQKAVADSDTILNGEPGKAGLRQVMDERRQADIGDGLGRLVLAPVAADTVSVSQEAAGLPFGFTLDSIASTLTGATASGPGGAPPAISIALGSQPQAGQTVMLTLSMPDGSKTDLTLTAGTSTTAGEFAIGATVTDTANNLRTALSAALTDTAGRDLAAASGIQAAREFFAGAPPATPMRVSGLPLATATALVAGTSSDTTSWYLGDNGPGDPRDAAVARVDDGVTVGYGLRANETGFAGLMSGLAALVADDFSANSAADRGRAEALVRRVKDGLGANAATLGDIQADIGTAAKSVADATDRHKQTAVTIGGLIDNNENADSGEVSAQLLSLQNRMQASYQAAALILHLSLTNYLG